MVVLKFHLEDFYKLVHVLCIRLLIKGVDSCSTALTFSFVLSYKSQLYDLTILCNYVPILCLAHVNDLILLVSTNQIISLRLFKWACFCSGQMMKSLRCLLYL